MSNKLVKRYAAVLSTGITFKPRAKKADAEQDILKHDGEFTHAEIREVYTVEAVADEQPEGGEA